MSDFCSKELVLEAKQAVAGNAYSPKKLTLIHAGIAAGASLVMALLTYFLDAGIGNTGGLSGIGSRAVLQTAQSVLQMLISVLSPFWAMGFVAAAVSLARRQQATVHTLAKGLRRWGPALRLLLLQSVIYFLVTMVAVQLGSTLYTLTPASNQLSALLNDLQSADTGAVTDLLENLDEATLMNLMLSMLPFLLIPMAALLIPVVYRMRFAEYVLMDDPRCGAFFAVMVSFRLTKGNCMKIFKLDIRYWWFYALEVLVSLLAYGDVLLPLFGVPLSMSTITASMVFYVLALGGQLVLYTWKKPQVFTTYALLYDRLLPREEVQM